MRLCWRRAAAMWYRDDGVSPLGSCEKKRKHQINMITDNERTNPAAQYNVHYVQTIPVLFLLSIWPQQIPNTFVHRGKKKLWQKMMLDSSHLVWVSEYYCTITWTKTKESYQNSCHANWCTLHCNDKCSGTMTGNISEIFPSTGCVLKPNMSNLKLNINSTREGRKFNFKKR